MKLFNILFLIIVLNSCSKNEQDISEVQMEIPSLKDFISDDEKSLLYATADAEPVPYAPEDLSGFDCVLVNVVGDGIGDWTENRGKVGSGKNYSYFGTFSQMVDAATGGTVSVRIKKGSLRHIQLIGVKTTLDECPSSVTASDLKSTTKFPGLFIIGSVQKNIFQSEDVSIKPTYSPSNASDVRYEKKEDVPPSIDTTSPDISKSEFSVTSTQATWTHATDDGTWSQYLKYKLVTSQSSDAYSTLQDVDAVDEKDSLVFWERGITSATISDLDTTKNNYFWLLVKDQKGNKNLYPVYTLVAGGGDTPPDEDPCENPDSPGCGGDNGSQTIECLEVNGLITGVDIDLVTIVPLSTQVISKIKAKCSGYTGNPPNININGSSIDGTYFGTNWDIKTNVSCPSRSGGNLGLKKVEFVNSLSEGQNYLGRITLKCGDDDDDETDEIETNDYTSTSVFGDSEGMSGSIECEKGKFLKSFKLSGSGTNPGHILSGATDFVCTP